MKKSSIRNLVIATGIVAIGGYTIKKLLDSKKSSIVEKEKEEIVPFSEGQSRKYHTLCYIKKKNSTEE